jgi:hypothetical protein
MTASSPPIDYIMHSGVAVSHRWTHDHFGSLRYLSVAVFSRELNIRVFIGVSYLVETKYTTIGAA